MVGKIHAHWTITQKYLPAPSGGILAAVIVDGQNLSDLLLAKKLAVPYDG